MFRHAKFCSSGACVLAVVLLVVLQQAPVSAQSRLRTRGGELVQRLQVIPMRGRTNMFARLPIFNGFRNLMRVIRPNVHIGRKSDYRSDFDENYINYHGAQLWKVMLGEHKRELKAGQYESRRENITEFVQMFLDKFGKGII